MDIKEPQSQLLYCTYWLGPSWLMWDVCVCLDSAKVPQGHLLNVSQVTFQRKISICIKPGRHKKFLVYPKIKSVVEKQQKATVVLPMY